MEEGGVEIDVPEPRPWPAAISDFVLTCALAAMIGAIIGSMTVGLRDLLAFGP